MGLRQCADSLDDNRPFCYLTGEREKIGAERCNDILLSHFIGMEAEQFEGDDSQRLDALNHFWLGIPGAPVPFVDMDYAYHWLYHHLVEYKPFCEMFRLCRGTAVSLQELADSIFPEGEKRMRFMQ